MQLHLLPCRQPPATHEDRRAHGFLPGKINSLKTELTPCKAHLIGTSELFATGELRTPLCGARYLGPYRLSSYPNQKRALTQRESNARNQTNFTACPPASLPML